MRRTLLQDIIFLLNIYLSTDDSVSLIVQIRLCQNRTDLALKEVQAAKRWAQDNLLVNLAESWVGLRVVSYIYQNLQDSINGRLHQGW